MFVELLYKSLSLFCVWVKPSPESVSVGVKVTSERSLSRTSSSDVIAVLACDSSQMWVKSGMKMSSFEVLSLANCLFINIRAVGVVCELTCSRTNRSCRCVPPFGVRLCDVTSYFIWSAVLRGWFSLFSSSTMTSLAAIFERFCDFFRFRSTDFEAALARALPVPIGRQVLASFEDRFRCFVVVVVGGGDVMTLR